MEDSRKFQLSIDGLTKLMVNAQKLKWLLFISELFVIYHMPMKLIARHTDCQKTLTLKMQLIITKAFVMKAILSPARVDINIMVL